MVLSVFYISLRRSSTDWNQDSSLSFTQFYAYSEEKIRGAITLNMNGSAMGSMSYRTYSVAFSRVSLSSMEYGKGKLRILTSILMISFECIS